MNFNFLDTLDTQIEQWVSPLANTLSSIVFWGPTWGNGFKSPLVVLWLVVAAVFFTVYFKFINIKGFKIALGILSGKYKMDKGEGEVSHFQALSTALSGTVGIGNIGGVAIAVSLGGPGAVFWLIMAGFLGMTVKFVECTLGIKYRRKNEDGTVSGGPMFFLEKGFAEKGRRKTGKVLGSFYAIGIVFGCLGAGNMFQANQAFAQLTHILGPGSWLEGKGWFFGLILAVAVGLVILGGIKSIAKVTEKLVPFMAVTYVFGSLVVLAFNYDFIPAAFATILKQAFFPEAIKGGFLGVLFLGFQRALFSNEAGIGSSSIAHSAVKSDEPYSEGFVSMLEPFIDTVIICTVTALVIVTSQLASPEIFSGVEAGVAMTSKAFASKMAWSETAIGFIVLLFAFSTIISWSYYGLKGWSYVLGESRLSHGVFKIFFLMAIIVGCSIPIRSVISFSDATVFLISIPNIIGLYYLAPKIKRDLVPFMAKIESLEKKSESNFKSEAVSA